MTYPKLVAGPGQVSGLLSLYSVLLLVHLKGRQEEGRGEKKRREGGRKTLHCSHFMGNKMKSRSS